MKNKFSLYQKWTSDYLSNEEIDGMCAIIIYNTFRLLMLNGIKVENYDWFDADIIKQLSIIDLNDNCDELTSFHISLFKMFNNYPVSSSYEQISKEYEIILNKADNNIISCIKKKHLYMFNKIALDNILLIGCLLECYRSYEILVGNAIFRTIIKREIISIEAITSAYSFLCMQQNTKGYWGFYTQKEYNINDIRAILCISFDCIATILKYEGFLVRKISDNIVSNKQG